MQATDRSQEFGKGGLGHWSLKIWKVFIGRQPTSRTNQTRNKQNQSHPVVVRMQQGCYGTQESENMKGFHWAPTNIKNKSYYEQTEPKPSRGRKNAARVVWDTGVWKYERFSLGTNQHQEQIILRTARAKAIPWSQPGEALLTLRIF